MVARVSNQNNRGQVVGVSAGTATITATFMGLSASAQVTVNPAALTRIAVSPVLLDLRVGQTQPLAATAIYSDGSTQDVTGMSTWSSSMQNIAGVSNRGGGGGGGGGRGQVTGLAAGSATITAAFMGFSDTATVNVTAAKLTGLSLSPIAATLTVGQQQPFQATALFDDGSTQNVTGQSIWMSSDPMIADVSNSGGGPMGGGRGVVAGLAAGTATISASYMGLADMVSVTVSGARVTALQVTPANLTLPRQTTQPYQAVAI
jgi:uncharacterized protein YjdB